jgi:hypothetical protein
MTSHKITIEIETGNDAFRENGETYEIGRILTEFGKRLHDGGMNIYTMSSKLYDINGNAVGIVKVEPC